MSKEKQIEEMAKDLGDTWVFDLEGNPHDLSEVLMQCDIESISEQLYEMNYRKASEVVREINDLRILILLSENIAIKCKRENGSQNEEYWKGKIAAFREIRGYIDTELKRNTRRMENEGQEI